MLDCEFVLTENFELPAGETLTIPPGSTLTCLPGVTLTIRGELFAPGSAEHPITIAGQDWDGLEFLDGGTGLLSHCRIHDVRHEGAGGALRLADQARVRLTRCLVYGNESSGDGGAAWLAGESVLSLQACTIAHNRGAATGGVQLEGGLCLLEANLSLVTNAEPTGSEIRGAGFVHLMTTDIFPQQADFPPGMAQPYWRCDPGYLDPASGDFQLPFWAAENSSQVSCTIDVSIIPCEDDPDGTPGDMGAFPFDQHQVLRPATILAVTDRTNDQGGCVMLEFLASPNDGSPLNPTTLYSIWIRYPGMGENEWVAAGTVAALANPGQHYLVQAPVSSTGCTRWSCTITNGTPVTTTDGCGPPRVASTLACACTSNRDRASSSMDQEICSSRAHRTRPSSWMGRPGAVWSCVMMCVWSCATCASRA